MDLIGQSATLFANAIASVRDFGRCRRKWSDSRRVVCFVIHCRDFASCVMIVDLVSRIEYSLRDKYRVVE